MKLVFIIAFLFVTACSCKPLKYVQDAAIPSGVAGTPEYLVQINGKYCKDADGTPGGCYVKFPWDQPTVISILPQKYAYRLTLTCSSWITVSPGSENPNVLTRDVFADAPVEIVLPESAYNGENGFICIGRIFPRDRPEPLSAFFEFRARLFDPAYVARGAIYMLKGYEVFGEDALYSKILHDDIWKDLNDKTTAVKTGTQRPAMSESYNMRYNYHGL